MTRTQNFSRWRWAAGVVLLVAGSYSSAQTMDGLRYKVYYQCNGERVQVDHCRKDDDGKGYGPPTKPQENYCLVYYPDRPRRSNIMVQSAELYDNILKKLQACGALSGASQASAQLPPGNTPATMKKAPAAAPSGGITEWDVQALSYFKAKDYPRAIEACKKAIAADPTNSDAMYVLGLSLTRLKRFPEAVAALEKSVKVDPKNVDHVYALAEANFFAEDYPRAISWYEAALNLEPRGKFAADAYRWIGESYDHLKEDEPAAKAYRQSLALNPEDAEVLHELGMTDFILAQYAESEKSCLHSLRLKPDQPYCNYFLGWIYNDRAQYEKAIPYFQAELRVDPKESDAHRELGFAYLQLAKYPDALRELQQSVRDKPNDAEAQLLLGKTYLKTGNKSGAEQVERALQSLDKKRAEELQQLMNKSEIPIRKANAAA